MVCEDYRSNLKKYASRPSPPFPANEIECHFRTFVGNDGTYYSSQPDKHGIFKWVPVVKKGTRKSTTRKSPSRKVSHRRSPLKKSPARKAKSTRRKSPVKKSPGRKRN